MKKFSELQHPTESKVVPIRLIEPIGHTVPLATYQIIGQWCDNCNDVEMHVFDKRHKTIVCINCKTSKQLK